MIISGRPLLLQCFKEHQVGKKTGNLYKVDIKLTLEVPQNIYFCPRDSDKM